MTKTFLKELEEEALTTRKMLAIVPADKFDWQPHPKSMTVKTLAAHIAELPTWVTLAVTTEELDFSKTPYEKQDINSNEELMAFFEASLADGRSHLAKANEQLLSEEWTLRNGEQIYMKSSKAEVVRHAYSQIIHHRAQLGVFLRLLDIPIPASYGSSADDISF
ncbi:DinB family protein [Pedobacter steynii]|nr:DinB family protein [Pedobacter steynii]